ncbi:hypothetical protein [Halovenus sp. HT40]|uniref:hypothetical protein n=1 Tax=Halovenus sp. HT40 TaxID=3126691 RepID=UPI00300F47FE
MQRRTFIASLGAAGVAGGAGCSSSESTNGENQPGDSSDGPAADEAVPEEEAVPFRVGADGFERWTGESYEPLAVQGVNLGMAKPGRFPGEAAITREEYDRWLANIGEIANVLRTYTIHPPDFYRALAAYNDGRTDPLLLLQGTWVPTPNLLEAGDATELSETVDAEIHRTVDAIHGATTLEKRPGHAAGTYDADVSDATLGFLFGIEWPPEVVAETNQAGADGEFSGAYLRAENASAFEQWLANRLETIVRREMSTYGVQRPVSFVNWVTTDPLSHPYEPFPDEDRVGVDPDAIQSAESFDAGTLASYHVYPYYPDLLNETPEYTEYIDHRGEPNNYAGYLDDLVGATDHPVLVAEFGVPSSRGISHRGVHDRDQGGHTEQEQGEIVAAMFEDIDRADTAGGIAFSWQNEWFKRTWNLANRSVPGRRPYWSNIETPEQRFGLLAFEPVDGVSLDGSTEDWTDAAVYEATTAGTDPMRTLTELRVTHDVEGLDLRLEFEDLPNPVDWTRMNAVITVGLTGRTPQLPFGTEATAPADFVVRLGGPGNSRLLVDSRYDAFAREFGAGTGLDLNAYRDGSAGFVPVRETINRGYTVPQTGERRPFEAVETGTLRYGNGNPEANEFDSLTDVHVAAAENAIELRLPWILLNVADPSSKQRIATEWEGGLSAVDFESLQVGAATFLPETGAAAALDGGTNLTHGIPAVSGERLETIEYGWEPWDVPEYEERLKRSYEILRERLS